MVQFLIHRPIAVIMTTIGLLILGAFSFGFIPVSLMPDIDIPEITVQVEIDNMSSRQIEDVVLKTLRSTLIQVSHVKNMESEAKDELGTIKLYFTHEANMDYAFIEVNEKIDRVVGSLPKIIKRPKVMKAGATDIPVFYLSMNLKESKKNKAQTDELHPVSQEFVAFSNFVDKVIKKRVEQIEEVAMVDISGLVSPEIVIIPDQNKLDGLGFTLADIELAIKKNNLKIGSLLIRENQYQYDVRLGSSLTNAKEIESIYISKDHRVFQLKELAQVIAHPQKRTGLVLSDGNEAVTMAIIKQNNAKMSDLKIALYHLIETCKKEYPEIHFAITRDQTKLLDYAINNLFQSLLWGMLLAFLIMFLFLKNIRSPLLIAIAVPISLTVSLLFFYVLNISINIISLSGLVLGIGLMIDNSIIVIDNISQYRERGYQLSKSCTLATNEVIRPLLSSALTTCAVFLPLVFLSGISGALFYDQAMAISIGLFVSLLVSVTLLPTLYHLFHIKDHASVTKVSLFLKQVNRINYQALYKKGFCFVMRRQGFSWMLCFFLLLLALVLFKALPKKQLPELTHTDTLLKIDWNEQIHVEENKRRILDLCDSQQEKFLNLTALVGTQQFLLHTQADAKASETTLYIQAATEKELWNVKAKLTEWLLQNFPKAIFTYNDVDTIFSLIFSDNQPPLVAKLTPVENIGSHQNNHLKKLWHQLEKHTNEVALKPIAWQNYKVLVANQEKLMTYKVDPNTLFTALKSAFNAHEILSITENDEVIPVVLGSNVKRIEEILRETMVASKDSVLFQVKDFVSSVNTQDIKTIFGGPEGEYYPIDFIIEDRHVTSTMNQIKGIVNNDPVYNVSFSGSFFSNIKLMKELKIVLLLSLLLLYFVLASQFESFLLPLIILLEIPLGISGALLFLKLFGISINLMSMIGIVVMTGIVINDSILKIDTVIQLQRKGYSLLRALWVGGQRRLKPILMTSLTTILALIPLLLSDGLGAELQTPLAIALIGSMLIGTLVSLYFIPLCYYYFSKKQ